MASLAEDLAGWGKCPVERCHVSRPESLEALQGLVARGPQRDYVARGLGRAYGDSALNKEGGVILHTKLNRFLSFDEATGVLHCEAGVSFAEIIEALHPRGWFLPTTPGTKFVTVGGAIAADVHGKNHHAAGTFGSFVEELELLTASGEILRLSPSQRPELFWATVGGMGLTGVVLTAKVRLQRVETSYFEVTVKRNRDLDASLGCLADTDQTFRYSVAWVDCLSSGKSLGRSVLMLANDGKAEALPPKLRAEPLRVSRGLQKVVPFDFPACALNPLSVKAFNAVYYGAHKDGVFFQDYDKFFYPLDSVLHWNRIYGRRGFVQYQALFPPDSARQGLIELLEAVAKTRRASFLAVLKSSGAANPAPLSYLYPGTTLALDFPFTDDLPEVTAQLDRILLKHGGRLYLAKDSMMNAETFGAMYPRASEWKRVKAEIDPEGRFASSQGRRLGLVEAR